MVPVRYIIIQNQAWAVDIYSGAWWERWPWEEWWKEYLSSKYPIHPMDHPLISYQHTFNHELRLPDVHQFRGDGESFPRWAHHSPSYHRGCVVSQCLVGSMPLPWPPLGLNFSDGRQLWLLCAHLPSTEGWLFPWTCVRLNTVLQVLLPRNTQSTISWGKIIWDWKRPTPHGACTWKQWLMEEEQHTRIPIHCRRLFHCRKLWNMF